MQFQPSTYPSVPSRILILPAGELRGVDGRAWLAIREHVLARLRVAGSIPLDVEHVNHHDASAPIAGVLSDFQLAANGSIDAAVRFNDYGARTYAVGGWSISPVFSFDPSTAYNTAGGSVCGTVLTITSAALTKRPNFLALALNSAEHTEDERKICAVFGRKPEDLIEYAAPNAAGSAAPVTAAKRNVIGPGQAITGDENGPANYVTLLDDLSADHAQDLIARLADRTIPLLDSAEPGAKRAGELTDLLAEETGGRYSITARLALDASARRAFGEHIGPGRITPVMVVDDNSAPIDVISAVYFSPAGAAVNNAKGEPAQWPVDWTSSTINAFKRMGWTP